MKYAYIITEGRFRDKMLDERVIFVFSTLQKAMRQLDSIKSLVDKGEWFSKRENSFQQCTQDIDRSKLFLKCKAITTKCLRDVFIETERGTIVYCLSRHALDNSYYDD